MASQPGGWSLRRYRYADVPVRPATLVAGGAFELAKAIDADTQDVCAGLAERRGRCGFTIFVGLRLLAFTIFAGLRLLAKLGRTGP